MSLAFGFFSFTGCLANPDCNDTDTSCNPIALTSLLTVLSQSTAEATVPRWVMAGSGGSIFYSPDADLSSWQDVSPTGVDLFGVAYGAAGFIAVGAGGRVLTSPDGSSWTEQTSGISDTLHSIAYDQNTGIYAAVGGVLSTSDAIYTTTDGITWVDRSAGLPNRLETIVHTGTQWLFGGRGGLVGNSTDGITFNGASTGGQTWSAMDSNDSILLFNDGGVNLHAVATTAGLPNATGSHTEADLQSILFYEPGNFFLLGSDTGRIFTSTDGVGAATLVTTTPIEVRTDMVTNGTRILSSGTVGEIAISDDGVNWSVSAITASDLNEAAYGDVPMSQITSSP